MISTIGGRELIRMTFIFFPGPFKYPGLFDGEGSSVVPSGQQIHL